MSKFDRYVLSQLLMLFGFFSLILVAVYWINQAVQVFDQLIADGQSAGVVLAFTALSLPLVIAIVMPMAAFAAAVYVTNRLNSESELVVVQATGFSPFRLARPFLAFGLLVAAMTAVLLNLLVPAATLEAARQRADLANNATARFLSPGEFLHPGKGITFYIGDLTRDGVLKSVFLSDARNPARRTTYMAREAFLLAQDRGPQLVMLDGIAQTLTIASRRLAVTRFDDFAFDIGRLIAAVRPPEPTPRQLSTADLLRAEPEQIAAMGSTEAWFLWEAHNRITQPAQAVIATLIGFATLLIGAFSRYGVWRQIIAAIVLLLVVKMVDNVVAGWVRTAAGGWPLLYAPIALGGLTALGLLRFAGRSRRRAPAGAPAGAAA